MAKICGFVGQSEDRARIKARLEAMAQAMKHDPEAIAEYIYFDRGGIVLITSPFSNATASWNDSSAFLALCGHVVNFNTTEQPQSNLGNLVTADHDLQALHTTFQQHDKETLRALDGIFAFAHYDSNMHKFVLANDRYGFMPLYYHHNNAEFVFASEVKALVPFIETLDIDWESCADFFYIGHMMGNKTLFQQVHALNAAEVLTYTDGRLQQEHYADLTSVPVRRHEDVSLNEIAALFKQAVERRVQHNVSNTVLLSGGFDSRFVLGALLELGVSLRIVTLEGASERQGINGKYALLIANALKLDTDFRRTKPDFFASDDWLKVFYIQDGMNPNFGLGIVEIYPELDAGLGAVWDGLALDVALGGTHQFAGGIERNVADFIQDRRTHRLLLRLILKPQYFKRMDANFVQRLWQEIDKIPASENQFTHFLLKHRTRRRIAVNPHQLYAAKVDPMTPAADKDFMEYVVSIPSSLKLDHRLYIEVLKQSFPQLIQTPIVSGSSVFSFGERTSEQKPASKSGRLRKLSRRSKKILRTLGGIVAPRSAQNHQPGQREAARLVISILQATTFDRPCYNTRLLQRLFAAYRKGNLTYHKLFTMVLYIELWHALFLDKNPSLLQSVQPSLSVMEREVGS